MLLLLLLLIPFRVRSCVGTGKSHGLVLRTSTGGFQGEDVMTSLRRFYSNINTDPEKQDAMNLFLGRFVPQPGKPPVWELGNDAHLHASRGLLLDEDNFDIFWGETLGQPLISPMDTARDAPVPVPPSSAAIALLGHHHDLHHPHSHWGSASFLGMASMPSWTSTLCSGTDRSSLHNRDNSLPQRGEQP